MKQYLKGAAAGSVITFAILATIGYDRKIARFSSYQPMFVRTHRELEQGTLKGAWIMSFTSSGSEQVSDLLQELTGTSMGTNYGDITQDMKGAFVKNTYASSPIWHNHPNGPFKTSPHMPLPEKLIPIVTHCGGVCYECHPQYYMIPKYVFANLCHTGTKFTPFGAGKTEKLKYDHQLIDKAVQLVRPPFDNVVSRFFDAYTQREAMNDKVWLNEFPKTSKGFFAWCAEQNERFHIEEKMAWQKEIFVASEGVPCAAEFYRYIQWHNMIYKVVRYDMVDIPLKIIHTKDLQENFENTITGLLGWLELDLTVNLKDYSGLDLDIPGYMSFFSIEQRHKIACFMKKIADPTIVDRFARYFTDCPESGFVPKPAT